MFGENNYSSDKRWAWALKNQYTNFSLLSKWLWRFHNEPNALWRKIIIAKYKASIIGKIPTFSKFCTAKAPWRSIVKGLDLFETNITWEINNGENISFWHDRWSRFGALANAYARLYALSQSKICEVKEMWNSIEKKWDLKPHIPLNNRECYLWNQISFDLPIPNKDKGRGKPNWNLENNKVFTTASVKKAIQISPTNENNGVDNRIFKALWKSPIPKKCKFFPWSILHEGINTMDKLQRRQLNTCLNPNWCVMCHSECETSDHLLVNCRPASFLWEILQAKTRLLHHSFNDLKAIVTSILNQNYGNI